MKRRQRVKAIWIMAGSLLAVAAILVPLLVLAGSNDVTLTATAYSDVIRFAAEGAASLRVRVYDLSEKLLWDSGEMQSEYVDWNRTDDWGERLANGQYVYLAQGWDWSKNPILNRTGKVVLLPGDQVQLKVAPTPTSQNDADRLPSIEPMDHTSGTSTFDQVGIGTTTPLASLHVVGNILMNSYQGFLLTAPDKFGRIFTEHQVSGQNPVTVFLGASLAGENDVRIGGGTTVGNAATRIRFYTASSQIGGSGSVRMAIDGTGNVGIGTITPLKKLHVAGDSAITGKLGVGTTSTTAQLTVQAGSGDLIAAYNSADRVFVVQNDGTVKADGTVYAAGFVTTSGAADVAERINVSEWVEAGEVVEIDPDHPGFFRKSASPYSTRVAGVISTSPAVILGNQTNPDSANWTDNRPVLAIAGRVPVKVSCENGTIAIGDLLVASSMPGVAMRGDTHSAIGAVVGKAMEPFAESGEGEIMAQVMLR